MSTDTVEFWNEIWSTMDHTFADHDQALADFATELKPGRTLDLGCGSGGNALWLAERGWRVTGVDFSDAAIEKGKTRAAERGVEVEFVVSDVATYRPDGQYDLVTSFYIQLWPDQRARMLAAAEALAPGGRLLFVSHDKSSPPSGWSQEDLASLTTPDEVVAELPGLRIELAEVVVGESGAHMSQMPDPDEDDGHEHHHPPHEPAEDAEHSHGATTVVVAVRPR